jgi:Transposase DDE domain/SEC-C motif
VGLTLSDSGLKSSHPAGALTLPSPRARNEDCHCGSGRKYKRCCYEQDEIIRRPLRPTGLPPWLLSSRGKLQQFEKYACHVFDLPALLASLTDSRRAPEISTFDVVNSLFHTALLRIPSLNALEGDLKESDFQKLIGRPPTPQVKAFSADVVANVLDKLHLDGVRGALQQVVDKAERNKVFREGSYGGLRCVAIDGWEPFASYERHCPQCLVRQVKVKRAGGEVEEVKQYFHRYVVALLLGPVVDVVLAIEPVLNEEACCDRMGEHAGHEGELTAALRLLDLLHQSYGSFLDAVVVDALYANGPWMTRLDAYGYGGFIILKKENHEPFKEALALWHGQGPCQIHDDPQSKEHIEFWDTDEIQTLDTYQGKVRVIRAMVTKPEQAPSTWCFAIVGQRARRVSRGTALKISRSRWHIENTAFHQWIQHWNFGHVFRHTANAVMAVLLLWTLAFNLLQLFVYRRLKRPRRPKDPTDTIRHIVEIMLREMATLPAPLPWKALLDSS